MKKIILTALALLASRFFKGVEQKEASILGFSHLKMSILYLKGVKTLRLLFIGMVGLGISLMLLLVGLLVLNTTIFLYMPVASHIKMYIGLFSAFIYCAAAGAIFYYVFSQETWMSMFHANEIIDDLSDEINPQSRENQERKEETPVHAAL